MILKIELENLNYFIKIYKASEREYFIQHFFSS